MLPVIPSGKQIFIDSNIFIYHFLGLKDSCTQFLKRVEEKDIIGFTSIIVLTETWHRLMVAECIEICNIAPRKAVAYLKKHPNTVKQLSRSYEAVSAIPQMNITVWNLPQKIISSTQTITREHGFLVNDSINLALMRQHRIQDIATNDSDFELIKNIKTWKPKEK